MGNQVVHFEINAADGQALESFYAELFGWHVQSIPEMGYGMIDTHAGAGINGGIGTVRQGTPFVTFYVEVPDPQEVLGRAEPLGATTVMPVTEVPGVVTFALFADPQGNRVGIVKSGDGEEAGAVSPGEGTEVSWFEVLGPDPDALLSFYTELFGWQAHRSDSGDFVYHEIDTGSGKGIAGGIGGSPDGQPHVNVYAKVDDLQKYLERAESLGGKTIVPPMDVSEGTAIAQFADPQGNVFGLYRATR